MDIEKKVDGNKLTLIVTGRLDTTTAPELDQTVKESLEGVEKLTMDFSDLEYISSAGLRVLLQAQKVMDKQGSMVITGVNDVISEIFEVTGFQDFLTIE
jgi:anti-sigma B factor antagonist